MSNGKWRKFTSVGGYPLFYLMADNGVLCADCLTGADADGLSYDFEDPQWYVEAYGVNWEDPHLYCEHCSGRIESAYAEEVE